MNLHQWLRMPEAWRPPIVVSDGMGVDSQGVLLLLKRLGIRPKAVLHADTGNEKEVTIQAREWRRRWLAENGFPELTMVRRPPGVSKRTGLPYATIAEKAIAYEIYPGITFDKHSCSKEWKIDPMDDWVLAQPWAKTAIARGQGVWRVIGYDAGPKDARRGHEIHDDHRFRFIYPLRDVKWDRGRIQYELSVEGIRQFPKSACKICKANKPWEIAQIVAHDPKGADEIIAVEAAGAARGRTVEGLWGRTVKGQRGAVPHPGRMTDFINQLRSDPAELKRHLAMAPRFEVNGSLCDSDGGDCHTDA